MYLQLCSALHQESNLDLTLIIQLPLSGIRKTHILDTNLAMTISLVKKVLENMIEIQESQSISKDQTQEMINSCIQWLPTTLLKRPHQRVNQPASSSSRNKTLRMHHMRSSKHTCNSRDRQPPTIWTNTSTRPGDISIQLMKVRLRRKECLDSTGSLLETWE